MLAKLKEENQDFEWYPTTREIIKYLYQDFLKQESNNHRFLDIGAGNGKVFSILEELAKEDNIENYSDDDWRIKRKLENFYIKKYAIEKSQLLIQTLPEDVNIIGTDFHEQSLLDKEVDTIFCNPPYSEFQVWTNKILAEGNCKQAYLVIPERWEKSKIIDKRKINYEVLGEFSFENSEDRKARAKVHLIRFDFPTYYRDKDPFDIWFEENFKLQADKTEKSEYEIERNKREKLQELIVKENLVKELVKFYNADMEKLLNNYKAIESLSASLLKDLNVSLTRLKEGLKLKIEGLKNSYWKTFFDRLDTITDRLTAKSREKMMGKLLESTNIDFTESNCYAIVIWIIKNANKYLDEQLLSFYADLTAKNAIINYKSNKRIVDDSWRFIARNHSHYKLDYRIVTESNVSCFGGYEFDKVNGLNKYAYSKIKDLITVANNLGFSLPSWKLDNIQWSPGKLNSLGDLVDIRCYKNGNIHYKFNQDFMKKLNIEASRLNGWIKSPKEAVEETGIVEAFELWGNNKKISVNDVKLLDCYE